MMGRIEALYTRPQDAGTAACRKRYIAALILSWGLLIPGLHRVEAQSTLAERPYSCSSLRLMGHVCMASGGYEKAQPFLERALHVAEETSGSNSDVYACMLDLAFLYKSQGKLKDAEKMCLSGLELQEKALREDHPYVAYTLRILSEIYRGQGRYREAESSLERAISIIHRVRPEDDQQSAPFLVDMGRVLVECGRLAEAETYFDKALPLVQKSFGPEHLYTTKVLTSLASLYVQQKRFAEAGELILRVLPIQERIYGADHHLLVPVWLLQAAIRQAEGDLGEAKLLLDKSWRVVESQPDSGRPAQGKVLIGLGKFYLLNKEYARARDALEKALDIQASIFDEYHPRVADALETLAELHRQTGNIAEATRLQQRAKDIRVRQGLDSVPVARIVEPAR